MKSPLIFRIYKNEQIHTVKQFVDKDQILFGHEAEVDIDLESTEVSAIHCLIEKRGQQFFICDLGSTQGTYKNSVPVLDEVINSGDEFTVGPFRVIFFVGAPKPVHSPKTSSEVVIQPVVAPVQAATTTTEAPAVQPTAVVKPVTPKESVAPAAAAVVATATAAATTAAATSTGHKPSIHSSVVASSRPMSARAQQIIKSRKRGAKTFAPDSQVKDLREYIRPGKGPLVEVIVAWKERVLNTYHFAPMGIKKAGQGADIQIPAGVAPKDFPFIDCSSGVVVRTTADMKVEVHSSTEIRSITENAYRLQQNETVFVSLNDSVQLIVRFAPSAPPLPLDAPFLLSSNELTGILAAFIIAALMSLIVSVTVPKTAPVEEEVQRVAQVIFTKPPVPPVQQTLTTPPPPKDPVTPPPPPPKPPEQPKKITETDAAKQAQAKGDPKRPDQAAQKATSSGKTADMIKTDNKQKKPMFSQVGKQGGSIKTGPKSGSNMASKDPDKTNQGLPSTFGIGGLRQQLDKASSGAGDLIGDAGNKTGAAGFSDTRAGADMGNRIKNVGGSGSGTSTIGIQGSPNKGRGYGSGLDGVGFGGKDSVAVEPGGAEEEFVGSIDREAVRRVVRSALPSFKSCYDREYRRDTKLEGKVVISWEIHAAGVAKNAKVIKDKSTLGNSAVEECVRRRMLELKFPEPPTGTFAEVTYPFLFQGQK